MKNRAGLVMFILIFVICLASACTSDHTNNTDNDRNTAHAAQKTKVDVDAEGQAKMQGGEKVLEFTAEGVNQSSHPIKKSDEVYVTFHLPEKVYVNQKKLKDKDVYISGDVIGLRLQAPEGEQFTEDYTIPLKDKSANVGRKKIDMVMAHLNDHGKLVRSVNGKADINVDVRIS